MLHRVLGLTCLLALCELPMGAFAQPVDGSSAQDWARAQIGVFTQRPDATWAKTRQALLGLFRGVDRDGNGVSPHDYERNRILETAMMRASVLTTRLARDLDNNGEVTRDELVAFFSGQAAEQLRSSSGEIEPTPEQRSVILTRLISDALKDDLNGDRTISFDEMRVAAAASAGKVKRSQLYTFRNTIPMTLDLNGDGVVTSDEFESVLKEAFRDADANGDDSVSGDEAKAFEQRSLASRQLAEQAEGRQREIAEFRARSASCGFPRMPERAKLLLVGSYEGRALSTASIGGDDREVTISRIDIEPGADPLYLVLTSYQSNIWLVTGAVDRVLQIVATASPTGTGGVPRVGVVGVEKEKVHVAPHADCLRYFSEHPSDASRSTISAATTFLDRAPDAVLATYGITSLSLPSGRLDDAVALPGTVALPTDGPAASMWKEMLRFNPAGLVRIDPGAVVSRLPVKRYEVLPQQAGLAQLIEDSSLKVVSHKWMVDHGGGLRTILGEGDSVVVEGKGGNHRSRSEQVPDALLILRKIRFPAGLSGAHSARFILARGVEQPEGDSGHSCVRSEETGAAILGSCR